MDSAGLAEAERALAPLVAPLCRDPVAVSDVTLFGEWQGGRFHQISRYALSG